MPRRTPIPWLAATVTGPCVLFLWIGVGQSPAPFAEWKPLLAAVMLFGLPVSAVTTLLLARPAWRFLEGARGGSIASAAGLGTLLGTLVLLGFVLLLRSSLAHSFGGSRPVEPQRWLQIAAAGALAGACSGRAFWFAGGRHERAS